MKEKKLNSWKIAEAAFFLGLLLMLGCTPQPANEMPQDLTGLKALLKDKKQQLKSLNDEIADIEARVIKLDTNMARAAKLVTVASPERKDFNHYVTIQGAVQADDIVNVSSEVGGRIISLNTKEGQYVRKGQLIAKVDVESVEKQIAEVEKSLELAIDVYERQSRLWEQKIGSEVQYLQAKNNKERLEKSLETLKFQLTKANAHASISGAVDKVFLNEGELAMPGAPIVQILSTSRLKVVADAPENLLGSVRRGDRVQVVFPSLRDTVRARISLLGRSIDPANRTFALEMNLPNKNRMYKPNLLAEISVNDYTEKDAIIIPLELVQQEVGGKDYVMVKSQDGNDFIAEKRYVETGDSYGGEIVISSGLEVSDLLILDGARGLANRELIEIADREIGE